MDCKIGFFSSINSGSFSQLSLVQGFDEYFSYTGNRYRVIDTYSSGKERSFRVIKESVNVNVPLNILKAISMMTILIPIIMGIGKLISRNLYTFYADNKANASANLAKHNFSNENGPLNKPIPTNTSKSQEPGIPHVSISDPMTKKTEINEGTKNSDDEKKKPKDKITHLPASSQLIEWCNKKINEFKSNALKTLDQSKAIVTNTADFSLSDDQIKLLNKALDNRWNSGPLPGGKIVVGGERRVLFLDSIPGFVFKVFDDNENNDLKKEYLERVNKARKLVNDSGWHLLYVPEARIKTIASDGTSVIMEKRANISSGDYRSQKGMYDYCWNQPELRKYMRTLFKQLSMFIVKFNFADVKYDNIPLTDDGQVALIDLDQRGVQMGLTKGGAGKGNDGLFNYLPANEIDTIKPVVLKELQLSSSLLPAFEGTIENIKKGIEEKDQKKKAFKAFLSNKKVEFKVQSLNADLSEEEIKDEKERNLALELVKLINSELAKKETFSPEIGRKVTLDMGLFSELMSKAKVTSGDENLSYISFKETIPKILDALKNSGFIFSYKLDTNYSTLSVKC